MHIDANKMTLSVIYNAGSLLLVVVGVIRSLSICGHQGLCNKSHKPGEGSITRVHITQPHTV